MQHGKPLLERKNGDASGNGDVDSIDYPANKLRPRFVPPLPVLEEPPRPSVPVVVPVVAERPLEQAGLLQQPVDPEQQLQGLLPLGGRILPERQVVVSDQSRLATSL